MISLLLFETPVCYPTPLVISNTPSVGDQGLTPAVPEHCKRKWALFEKWCRENSVDFTLSVKQVSDFFMYLYQDLNRQPSTIDGYRTAIVDTLGPVGHHISQRSDLHRLLSSFHRDHPKSSRNLPKWNLSGLPMVYLFICCFTSRSTARVILRRVVYRWRKPVHTAL